jgi:hypothetical protein
VKIGVLLCAYNTPTLGACLRPWKEIPNTVISAVSVPFKEFLEVPGFKKDEATPEILRALKASGEIDSVFTEPEFIIEAEAKTLPLLRLKELGVDLIWCVDADEIYDSEQIKKTIKFIENDEFSYSFSAWYKNFVFDTNTFYEQKFPNRIFRAKDVLRFYHDCDTCFSVNDGVKPYNQLPQRDVPPNILKVDHFTWLSDERSKFKCEYQQKHFGQCSYTWNHNENRLEFDRDYYKKHKILPPALQRLDKK